jgi:hypothetical protein
MGQVTESSPSFLGKITLTVGIKVMFELLAYTDINSFINISCTLIEFEKVFDLRNKSLISSYPSSLLHLFNESLHNKTW